MTHSFADRCEAARSSFRALFAGDKDASSFRDALKRVLDAFLSMERANAATDDAIDAANALSAICQDAPFAGSLDKLLLNRLAALAPAGKGRAARELTPDMEFFFSHAKRLCGALEDLMPDFAALIRERAGGFSDAPGPLRPSVAGMTSRACVLPNLKPGALVLEIAKRRKAGAAIGPGRIFRHRRGRFEPLELPSIRKADEFYGCHAARATYAEVCDAFSKGISNLPLLVSGLPGLGKTQMGVAFALNCRNVTLILPEPDDLDRGFEALIALLEAESPRKFLVFFDDIDADSVDWRPFRANVGGLFSLPRNIAVVIASNQKFPANVASRGRGFQFPVFDEILCQEMIRDFLAAKGMENPSKELVSTIAADYVEQFGQKKFEELSPRTLMRCLESGLSDPAKRKSLLEISKSDVVPAPDAQIFYDENLKLVRSVYGQDVVAHIVKEALHG